MGLCAYTRSLCLALAAAVACTPLASFGDAETYFDTHASIISPVSGGRFGQAIACSDGAVTADTSHIAIGAPDAEDNEGRVYIYSLADTPQLLETLQHPILGGGFHFGAAVAFIPDMNSDGRDDLIIGESSGRVHVFRSTGSTAYQQCTSTSNGAAGFGTVLHGARLFGNTLNRFIAGAPGDAVAIPFEITDNGPLFDCTLNQGTTRFGTAGFGASITEVAGDDDADAEVDTIVGGPLYAGNSGRVFLTGATTLVIYTGSSSEEAGTAVAGHPNSNYFAFSRPKASGGGNVVVRDLNLNGPLFECSVSRSGSGTAADFGKALRHLHLPNFVNVFPTSYSAVWAAYRSEASTGGSVGLFKTDGVTCSSEFQYNNCINDTNQEQGSVLAGGGSCTGHLGGSVKSALLVGSPGYSTSTGRIDIVAEGSDSASPITCSGGGGGGGGGGIPVSPGSGNLTAPTVAVSAKTVTVTAPSVTPSLSEAQRKKYVKVLQKKFGLSKKKAEQRLANGQLVVEYVYTIKVGLKTSAQDSTRDLQPFASSITRRSKRNSITFNRLPAGAGIATYKVQISTRKPTYVLGGTKPSSAANFTISN
jgi:hypothetical protein